MKRLKEIELKSIVTQLEIIDRDKKVLHGKTYDISYVNMDSLLDQGISLNGYATGGRIYLAHTLPDNVEQYVFEHEAFHINDIGFLSKHGRELRARLCTGLCNPIGFIKTVLYTFERRSIAKTRNKLD